MTIRYAYKCDGCDREYIEQRAEGESQFFSMCECSGSFQLETQEEL